MVKCRLSMLSIKTESLLISNLISSLAEETDWKCLRAPSASSKDTGGKEAKE